MDVIAFHVSHQRVRRLICALCLIMASTAILNAEEKVVIQGGNEQGGASYKWQVTNNYSSPIVRIEFPQYGADVFEIPAGWETGSVKEMNLVNVGWNPRKEGLCFAIPKSPNPGLIRGTTCNFAMRVPPSVSTIPGKKIVHVVFADGTSCDVANVTLPSKVEGSPLVMILGVAGLFVLCIVIVELRKRRATPSGDSDNRSDGEPI